jgi:hypothetical protein
MERCPTDGRDGSTLDFPPTSYYCIPFHASVRYLAKAIVTSEGDHMAFMTDICGITMVRRLKGIQRNTQDKEM